MERLLTAHKELAKFERAQLGMFAPLALVPRFFRTSLLKFIIRVFWRLYLVHDYGGGSRLVF